MGLFDKKKKSGDDFDSPVEEINLSAPPSAAPAGPPPGQAPEAAAPAAAPAPKKAAPVDYGINRAIELMRMLPGDNVELVVRVVKTTLESTNVKIVDIIEDASRKQKDIEARVDMLKKEIADLEAEIATRQKEIAALEADHKETTMVKERLILGEKLSGSPQPTSPPTPPASEGKTLEFTSDDIEGIKAADSHSKPLSKPVLGGGPPKR